MLKRLLLVCLLCTPVATWALYKPVRVLVPQWVPGVTCISDVICMDDTSRHREAAGLYDEALGFVNSSVGAIEQKPRIIFCASQACFRSFGFRDSSASTVGTSGIVIGPRAWKNYYVRHEMIHHLQTERLGILKQWRSPPWFREGMAYSLSEDPRATLAESSQRHRSMFENWYQSVGRKNLWEEARK